MAKGKIIQVDGMEIAVLSAGAGEDYLSLTDLAKRTNPDNPADIIANWLRNKDTLEFLGVWEKLNNPVFNLLDFEEVKNQSGVNRFAISPSKWVERTSAKGLQVKAGRYGGGTFAHRDIALGFCYWLSPPFQLYVLQEFQRLKKAEALERRDELDWNLRRTLAKVNYRIHTDTVKMHLIPPRLSAGGQEGIVYASEADLLNLALFGMTARQWKTLNPDLPGNLRDYASAEQLLVLANLESHNAQLIRDGFSQDERLHKLNEIAIYQLELLTNPDFVKQLKALPGGKD